MRKYRSLPLAAVLSLTLSLLAACGGQPANPPAGSGQGAQSAPAAGETAAADAAVDRARLGDTLNLFNWTEYLPEEVLQDFEQEYGVHVNYDTYSSNEEMAAKLQAGGGTYDLVVPSTYMITSLAKQGLLQPLDHSLIPNMKYLEPAFTNLEHDPGNQYSVPYMWGTVGIAYNSKYVNPAPARWDDLLDPKYKNRIVVLDDSREMISAALQAVGYSRNETDPARIQEAQEWLTRLVPNIKAWDSDSPKSLLISEEAWIGVVWNAEAALAMQENPDIKYAIPADGGGLWLDSVVIPKDAPHAYAAHVFINYILRPEVAAKIGAAFPYGLPNTEGYKLLPQEIRENPASYPPQEWLAKAEYAADIGEAAALFDRAFTEVKAGQ